MGEDLCCFSFCFLLWFLPFLAFRFHSFRFHFHELHFLPQVMRVVLYCILLVQCYSFVIQTSNNIIRTYDRLDVAYTPNYNNQMGLKETHYSPPSLPYSNYKTHSSYSSSFYSSSSLYSSSSFTDTTMIDEDGGDDGGEDGGEQQQQQLQQQQLEQLQDMKVTQLKDVCRELGVKVGGNKQILIQRIIQARKEDETNYETNYETNDVLNEEEEVRNHRGVGGRGDSRQCS